MKNILFSILNAFINVLSYIFDDICIITLVCIIAVPCIMSKYYIDNIFGISILAFTVIYRLYGKIRNSK